MIVELNCRRTVKAKPPERFVDKLIRAGLLEEVRDAAFSASKSRMAR
jgi:hypothetical protein